MISPDSAYHVLLFSSVGVLTAVLGALPFAGGRRLSAKWIGGASSLAGGAMLGAGYVIALRALELSESGATLGGTLGVVFTRSLQLFARVDRLDPRAEPRGLREDEKDRHRFVLQGSLHAAIEGAAIGVAMALDLSLGVFVALAFAVHNVGESVALSAVLRRRGASVRACIGSSIATKLAQPVVAIVTFLLCPTFGPVLPIAVGFAAGSLLFLVLSDVAPGSYEYVDSRIVAMLLSFAAGAVVLLESAWTGAGA